ncbi:hypothetical protein AAJN34_09555 [Staphylococcus haemolyticus]|uniref:hypothetical protein n=1 Tax=Staphylococcus haemolyticus TaxID=1283 RepID=UPI0031BBB2F8
MNKRYVIKINDVCYLRKFQSMPTLTKDVFRASNFELESLAKETAEKYGGKVMELTPKLEALD